MALNLKPRYAIPSLALALLITPAIIQQPQSEVVYRDGIEFRLNYMPVDETSITEIVPAEDVILIDGTGPGFPDEALIVRPSDVKLGSNGEIIVLDREKVKVFDSSGQFIRAFGDRGHGPGEIQTPARLFSFGRDTIAVGEAYIGQIHLFTLSGEFIDRISLPFPYVTNIALAPRGGFFFANDIRDISNGLTIRRYLLHRLGPQGAPIPFDTEQGPADSLEIAQITPGVDRPLSNWGRVLRSPHGYVLTEGTAYTIYRVNEAGIVGAFRRVIDPVQLPNWWRRYLREESEKQGQDIDPPKEYEAGTIAHAIDERGYLWTTPDDGSRFLFASSLRQFQKLQIVPLDEFDPEGHWVRHHNIEMPVIARSFMVTDADDGYLVGILYRIDTDAENLIVRFKRPE